MRISEFARKAGCRLETVRYYERIGFLPESRRSASGNRQRFRNAPRLPRLSPAGFHPVGTHLLATGSGPAPMVLARGSTIGFYIQPPSPSRGMLSLGQRREGYLVATYWFGNGYNYALVSSASAADVWAIHEASLSPST